jgi:hypothetical protein
MRLRTSLFCALAIALISWGCGSNPNPDVGRSSIEMIRVQTALEELHKESGAGVPTPEFTRNVNSTLARIGDLKESEKVADLGLPSDKVALVYDYFHQAAIAYLVSTQFVGTEWDAPSNKATDSTSDSERESLDGAFPELDPVDVMSRRNTLHDLLQIAQNETRDAGEMIKTL